jgi:hypothetical protein
MAMLFIGRILILSSHNRREEPAELFRFAAVLGGRLEIEKFSSISR